MFFGCPFPHTWTHQMLRFAVNQSVKSLPTVHTYKKAATKPAAPAIAPPATRITFAAPVELLAAAPVPVGLPPADPPVLPAPALAGVDDGVGVGVTMEVIPLPTEMTRVVLLPNGRVLRPEGKPAGIEAAAGCVVTTPGCVVTTAGWEVTTLHWP
jgi:hypothetical protein